MEAKLAKIVLGLSSTEEYKSRLKAFADNESTSLSGAFQIMMDHPEIYMRWLSRLLEPQPAESAENV